MIRQGKVSVLWKDEYKYFSYDKQPLMDYEIARWRELGYYNSSFSGHMYNSKNIMPAWTDSVAKQMQLGNCGFVFYRMDTLDIMPPHVDHFQTYVKLFKVNIENVYRAVVFLEDWKPGHYFEIDSKGCINWSAGDYVLWGSDIEHAAANIGTDPRYTLQITGTLL